MMVMMMMMIMIIQYSHTVTMEGSMCSIITITLISGVVTRCFSISVCHHRRPNLKHPRPMLMERRIMDAITQPVYSHQLNDPGKLCSVIGEEKQKKPKVQQEALIQVGI